MWAEPYRFEFFAALRVLARMAEERQSAGDDPRTAIDQLQFRAHQSLSFPPSEIWDIAKPSGGNRLAEMTVAFLGLTGPLGALPRPYSELVMQRVRKGDLALRDFFDLFNHRLLQLFAQAGEKYRFYLTYELAAARERWRRAQGRKSCAAFCSTSDRRSICSRRSCSTWAGVGTPLVRYKDSRARRAVPRSDVADSRGAISAASFRSRIAARVSLSRMLTEYFAVTAQIIPFIGQWIQLPLEHQTCLKRRDLAVLASPSMPSRDVRRSAARAATPSSARGFGKCKAGFACGSARCRSSSFNTICPWERNSAGWPTWSGCMPAPTFDFDIQPVLEGEAVPWCQFGAKGPRTRGWAGTPGSATKPLRARWTTPSFACRTRFRCATDR